MNLRESFVARFVLALIATCICGPLGHVRCGVASIARRLSVWVFRRVVHLGAQVYEARFVLPVFLLFNLGVLRLFVWDSPSKVDVEIVSTETVH
jgi:hypothetical protein